jgi:beta-lactamase regulating signal transducer with metallopeptidase domain
MIIPIEFKFAKEIYLIKLFNGVFAAFRRPIGDYQINMFTLLAVIWVVVALGLLIRFFYWYRKMVGRIYRFQKHNVSMDRLGGTNPIVISSAVASPMAIGLFKSKIVLPDIPYQPEELQCIIQHETIHIVHKDVWFKFVAEILCCLFWWNPIIHLLNKEVEQTLEIKCDLRMTRHMHKQDKATYLRALMNAVKKEKEVSEGITQYRLISNMRFFSTKSISLKERFRIISKNKGENHERRIQTLLMVFTICMFLLSYTMVFQTRFDPPDQNIMGIGFTPVQIEATKDGEYRLIHSDGSSEEIPEELVSIMEQDGVTVFR